MRSYAGHTHTHTHKITHIHIHTNTHTNTQPHTHTHTNTNTHTNTHTYTQAQTHIKHTRTHTNSHHTIIMKFVNLIKQRCGDWIKQAKRLRTLGLDRAMNVQAKMKRKIVHQLAIVECGLSV